MRLQVLKMISEGPYVGSFLSISSLLCAGQRFPVACLSGSVCIGFSHAVLSLQVVIGANNESSLDLMMFPASRDILTDPSVSMLKTSCCWKMMTILVRQGYEVVHCTCTCLPILGQTWCFAVFPHI